MSQQNIIIYTTSDGKTSVALYAKDGDILMNCSKGFVKFEPRKKDFIKK